MAQKGTEELLQAVINDAYDRIRGSDAQVMNIEAGQAIGEAVRTTLGPNGMDKMLVDSLGDVVITNDGATIIREMDIAHPAAKLLSEVANTQEGEAADGTTTAVVLAGELLNQAQRLLEDDIHPTTIARGYKTATEISQGVLQEHATEVSASDQSVLADVAKTAMTGTGVEDEGGFLSNLVIDAVTQVHDNGVVDVDAIQVESIPGGRVTDSECIGGTTIEKEPAAVGMPTVVNDASIAVLDDSVGVKEPTLDGSVSFDDHEVAREILDHEERSLKAMARRLVELEVDVVFVGEDVADTIVEHLARNGKLAFERTPTEALNRVVQSTGATVCSDVNSLTTGSLGFAGRVEVGANDWRDVVFVEEYPDTATVTLLLRGGTTHVMDEIERPVADAIGVVSSAIEDGKLCPGGGAMEVEMARQLRKTAKSVETREQLAIEAYADAVEVLPRTIAESIGMDPIDAIVELRRRHDDGEKDVGLDGREGTIARTAKNGIVEPLRVKKSAIAAATQAAVQILRIDDILVSEELPDERRGDTVEDMPR